MKIDTNKQENTDKVNVASAKLCFENLQCKSYKPGYIVTERNLVREKKNSALCELAKFTNIIVDECALNESKGTSTIYVRATASGKEDMQKLYEWIEKYAGKENVEGIAPGLLESLNINNEKEEENSVASRFAKYRKLYEEESMTEDDTVTEDDVVTEDDEDTEDKDEKEENTEEKEDEKEEDKDEKKDDEEEEEEQDELTAVIIEVAKGDEDKAKDELIEAGVDEDDIEILSNDEEESEDKEEEQNEDDEETKDEDEDKDETVKIKIAVDSFDALKEYLEGKGFDLEEELGGEIVSDDEEGEGDKEDNGEGEGDENMDDAFAGFDDLFADDGGDSEEK